MPEVGLDVREWLRRGIARWWPELLGPELLDQMADFHPW
jgi:hypothetical protein